MAKRTPQQQEIREVLQIVRKLVPRRKWRVILAAGSAEEAQAILAGVGGDIEQWQAAEKKPYLRLELR